MQLYDTAMRFLETQARRWYFLIQVTVFRNNDVDVEDEDDDDAEAVTMPDDNECSLLRVDEKLIDNSVSMTKNSKRVKIPVLINDEAWTVSNADSIIHTQLINTEELMEHMSSLMNGDEYDYVQFTRDVELGKKTVSECGSVTVVLKREGLSCKRQIYAATCENVGICSDF